MSSNCEGCDYDSPPSYEVSRLLPVCPTKPSTTQTQQRIWHQVRVPASMYLQAKAALIAASQFTANGQTVNWNQMSDRFVASQQTAKTPTHGNSLRSTLTSGKPGAGAPGGLGVDVKHDSYARFLNKRKASVLKGQAATLTPRPYIGNKNFAVGLVAGSTHCCPPLPQ